MPYVFMSFGSVHTGKNIGCCIVKVDDPDQANAECKQLGLMPTECNQARGYVLDTEEAFNEQGMELNRFYTKQQMQEMGFEIA